MSCTRRTRRHFIPDGVTLQHLGRHALPVSGLERTSKVNLGHIRPSFVHHLPPEVIVIVMTSSLNSPLETQEATHTCHQLLRYKSHKMKQPDPENKGVKSRHLIWLPRVNSPQIWAKKKTMPKLYSHQETSSCTGLISDWVYTAVEPLECLRLWRTESVHSNPSLEAPGMYLQHKWLRVCSYTSVNWVNFFFLFFLGLSK